MSSSEQNTLDILFEHSLDLLCIAGIDGRFRRLSQSWTQQLGWSKDELLSKSSTDMIHPEDRGPTVDALKRLINGKRVIDFENRYLSKTGQYHWLQWRAYIEPNDPTAIFAIARDITQTKQREIRASNDISLLEMAEQTARVGHWRLDTANGHLEWSNEVFNIYGRKANKANITLDDFIDAFSSQDRKKLWSLIQNAVQNGTQIEAELNLIRQDGEQRIVVVRAICERSETNAVKSLFGIIQDVTQERQSQSNLHSKEELLSMAFRATSDGIWDWDLRTDQMWYSPQWKKQLGYADDEINNEFDSWMELIFEEDRLKAMDAIDAHIRNETDRYEMVQRFRHKDGQTIFILTRAFAIRDKTGRAIRMVGAHTDITELKRLEQAKSEFTSIVSHELRTPLTAIHGAIGLLHGHYSDGLPDQVQSLIMLANNNSKRLILLVNDILDMEKLQFGRMDFDLREIALSEFLPLAIENHLSYAKTFNVTLSYDHEADDLSIIGDSNRLMQVMSNLLSNAIKFSKEGDRVKIQANATEGQVSISVIDTGSGIASNMREKIFDKFVQVDSSDQRNIGGTGLGLAISKAMIENMAGSISLTSELEKGSTFTVILPQA